MKRWVKVAGSVGLAVLGWAGGDAYYLQLQKAGRWQLEGEGPLWDSVWLARHLEAYQQGDEPLSVWPLYQALEETRLFAGLRFWYTGQGQRKVSARTRTPMARVVLPMRQYYLDPEGHRLPIVHPLDLPILSATRWDSVAFAAFLAWWKAAPFYHRALSYSYQDPQGVWHAHLQVTPETFVLGRTESLPQAFAQLDVYLRLLQPKLGAFACKTVLLHIPNQIVCQENEKL